MVVVTINTLVTLVPSAVMLHLVKRLVSLLPEELVGSEDRLLLLLPRPTRLRAIQPVRRLFFLIHSPLFIMFDWICIMLKTIFRSFCPEFCYKCPFRT